MVASEPIKIYLVTADDLYDEYYEIAELIDHLNTKSQNMEIERILHNQGLGELEDCDIFLTLYYTEFGDYSKNDFEEAYKALKAKGKNPQKSYVFFKNSTNIESEITKELNDFKNSFAEEDGHFFCKFEHIDTMRLNILLQLKAYQSERMQKAIQAFENGNIEEARFNRKFPYNLLKLLP